MEKTCLARTFHTFRVFILFFNVSVSYIIFTSCPSHFSENWILSQIWFELSQIYLSKNELNRVFVLNLYNYLDICCILHIYQEKKLPVTDLTNRDGPDFACDGHDFCI